MGGDGWEEARGMKMANETKRENRKGNRERKKSLETGIVEVGGLGMLVEKSETSAGGRG